MTDKNTKPGLILKPCGWISNILRRKYVLLILWHSQNMPTSYTCQAHGFQCCQRTLRETEVLKRMVCVYVCWRSKCQHTAYICEKQCTLFSVLSEKTDRQQQHSAPRVLAPRARTITTRSLTRVNNVIMIMCQRLLPSLPPSLPCRQTQKQSVARVRMYIISKFSRTCTCTHAARLRKFLVSLLTNADGKFPVDTTI